jgi:thiosulfate/3-mercaptopyruvate sulfurtransferase
MKAKIKILLVRFLLAKILLLSLISSIAYSETTRPIRRDDLDLLPVPQNVREEAGDRERFDRYVWSIQKLKDNYGSVIILDARTNKEYKKGHLPGAVRAHWTDWGNKKTFLVDDTEALAKKLGELGIDGSKSVIVYGDPMNGNGEEGRQLWTLRLVGLDNSFILDGGYSAWEESGGAIEKKAPAVNKTAVPVLRRDESKVATTEYVAENLAKLFVLDSRGDSEFAGKTNSGEKSKGRIPGARHIWFKDFYHDDGTILTPAEVRARLEALGVTPDSEIITYCTGGIRSALSAIALEMAGYNNVRNYNASFSGWATTKQQIDKTVYDAIPVP